MKQRSLAKLFTALIGGLSIGAHGSPCGSCPPTYTSTQPLLPKANGADGGVDAGDAPLDCATACSGGSPISCQKVLVDGGAPLVECIYAESCGSGRRTHGHAPARGRGEDEYGAWLAATASLERQAVHAFSRLARELGELGAPAGLVARAEVAPQDEVRHARTMTALARARKACAVSPRRASRARRTAVEIAIENAVEGCVRETFAALLAHHQAMHATDSALAAALHHIAREETAHAQLSHDVHAWLLTRLTPRERARVGRRLRAAADRLENEAIARLSSETLALAGLPSSTSARALARAMVEALGLAE